MKLECRRTEGTVRGADDLRLHFQAWEATDARAGLILVHGLADHGGRFAPFAEWMTGIGISSFALDLRGHGRSDGRRGHVARFDRFLEDLDRFRSMVHHQLEPGCPLFLVGHSMGGLITIRYLQEFDPPLHGAIVTSPWLATAHPVPTWKLTLSRPLSRLLPWLPFRAGIEANDLSHDPAMVGAYRDDPLVHDTITPRLFVEALDAMRLATERKDRVRVPLLLLIAGEDRLVDSSVAHAFSQRLEGDIEFALLDGQFHDLLNEATRDEIWTRVAAWVEARLA